MNRYDLYINGRILTHKLSGIPIYTREIIKYLNQKKISIGILKPEKFIRGIYGHLWEQVLPFQIENNALLWNPSGSGPILYNNNITTIHDISPIVHKEWFNYRYVLWYEYITSKLVKNSKIIITISEFSKNEIIKKYSINENKIRVIYNGYQNIYNINGEYNNNEIRNRYNIPKKYFLYVGTIEPRKNINIILKAWREFIRTRNDYYLIIIGAKDCGNVFKKFNLNKDIDNIILKGFVQNEELPIYYNNATALIYPSLYEGFGLPPLEALACGCNIILSDIPVHKEVYKNKAFYFNPQNHFELLQIMNQIEKIRIEKMELALFAKNYSLEKNCENTYRTIMEYI